MMKVQASGPRVSYKGTIEIEYMKQAWQRERESVMTKCPKLLDPLDKWKRKEKMLRADAYLHADGILRGVE